VNERTSGYIHKSDYDLGSARSRLSLTMSGLFIVETKLDVDAGDLLTKAWCKQVSVKANNHKGECSTWAVGWTLVVESDDTVV
jgi:hypothetical protein